VGAASNVVGEGGKDQLGRVKKKASQKGEALRSLVGLRTEGEGRKEEIRTT